ncbi:hypothetical protein HDU93_000162 [Gonapodya sp. JEL0774]|nr:hypothetical protein HDU93_000162 [Gonapodya sp. JEL0774]
MSARTVLVLLITFGALMVSAVEIGAELGSGAPSIRLSKRADPTTGSFTPAERDALITPVSYIAATFPGGLGIWTGVAKWIRGVLRTSSLQDPLATGTFSPQVMINNYLATIIILALGVGCSIVLLLGAPYICCCVTRARRKQYAHFERDQKVVAAILLGLNLACLAVAVLCGFLGSTLLSYQLQQAFTSANNTMTDAALEVAGLPPAVSYIINDVYSTIDQSVLAVVDSVGITPFVSLMGGKIAAIVATLSAVDTQLKSFNVTGRALVANVTDVRGRALVIGNQTNGILSASSNLNNQQPSPSGTAPHQYQLLAPISVPGSVSTPDLTGLPNINALLAPLNSLPDLGALGRSLNLQFNTTALNYTANSLVGQGLTAFKNSSKASIDGFATPIHNATTNLSEQANTQITSIQGQISNLNTEFVAKYDSYRNYGFLAVHALFLLLLISIIAAVSLRKPGVIRCCVFMSLPIGGLVFILACLNLILATILGDVCYYALDQRLAPLMPIIAHVNGLPTNFQDYVNAGFTARDSCVAGQRTTDVLLAAATTINLPGNLTDYVNLKGYINQTLMNMNLTGLIGGSIDFSSLVNVGMNVTQQVQPWYTANAVGFNWTTVTSLLTAFNTSQLDTFNSSLATLSSALTTSSFSYTPAAILSDQALDLTDFRNKIGLVTGNISTMKSSQIAVVNSELAAMGSLVTSLQSTATATNTNIGLLVTQYIDVMSTLTSFALSVNANLTTIGIPAVSTNFMGWADRSMGTVNTALECQTLAKDSYVLQNGLCVGILGGIDATWLAFYIEGLCIIFGIPIYVIAANRLAHRSTEEDQDSIPVKGSAKQPPTIRPDTIKASRPFPSPSAISGQMSPGASETGPTKISATTPRAGAALGEIAPLDAGTPGTESTSAPSPESPTFVAPDEDEMKLFAAAQREAATEASKQSTIQSSAYVGTGFESNETTPDVIVRSVVVRNQGMQNLGSSLDQTMEEQHQEDARYETIQIKAGYPLEGVETTVLGTHEILTGESPDLAPEALMQPSFLIDGVLHERSNFVVSQTNTSETPSPDVEVIGGSHVGDGDLYTEDNEEGQYESDDSD